MVSIQVQPHENILIMTLQGAMTQNNVAQFKTLFEDMYEKGWRQFIFDFGEVTQLDGAGLRELVAAYRTAKRVRGNVILVQVPEPIEEIIESAGFRAVFQFSSTQEQALSQF